MKYLNHRKFVHAYRDSFSNSINIYINILHHSMFIAISSSPIKTDCSQLNMKLQPSFQWPRTLKGLKKSDKGCLPLTVPEPTFLSDPSHRVRVLLRPAFMKSNGPVSLERPSKADCLRLKVYYGAWI